MKKIISNIATKDKGRRLKIFATIFAAIFALIALATGLALKNYGRRTDLTQTTAADGPTNPSTYWDDYRGSSFAGGDGSEGNPYKIATAAQLALLAYRTNTRTGELMQGEDNDVYQYGGCYFIQTNHIDLSAHYWVPIGGSGNAGYFCGTYDGNGYTISGLYTPAGNTSDYDHSGLFGFVSSNLLSGGQVGEIKNVGIVNSLVQGNDYVGAIAGQSFFAMITNCYNTSDVSGYNHVGGIAGNSGMAGISNCFNTGAIQGIESYVGGIVGTIPLSTAASCFNTGEIKGMIYSSTDGLKATQSIGGIIGGEGTAENCYNTGRVAWAINTTKGGIGGTNVSVYNCHYGGNCDSKTGAVNNADEEGGKYLSSLSENTFKIDTFFQTASNWSYQNSEGEVTSHLWDFSIWGVDGRSNQGFPHFINSRYKIDVNIMSPEGVQDYRSGTFTQTYNGKSSTGADQDFDCLYVYESWTISNIKPREGFKFKSISASSGTLTNNGNGTYTFKADYSKPAAGVGVWDAQIFIYTERENYTLTINLDGGTLRTETGTLTKTVAADRLYHLTTPVKNGYTFTGWSVTSGSLTLPKTNKLGVNQIFDGDNFVALGRSSMYSDKITVAIRAYMEDWSQFSSKAMSLISCAEDGGFGIEEEGEYIEAVVYDKGVGYKRAISKTKAANLADGWHQFVMTFDGYNARLYIDGTLEGESADFSSGQIGYHASNGIFIGAQAGAGSATPAGGYFDGIIGDYMILHDSIETVDKQSSRSGLNFTGNYFAMHGNATLKANWSATWAMRSTKPQGSGTASNPYKVDSAADLAYFANKTLTQTCSDHIVLTADINLSNYDWWPIGGILSNSSTYGFSGVFDGQGHKISNLKINTKGVISNTWLGLFGSVWSGGQIKNVVISSGQINVYDDGFTNGIIAAEISANASVQNVQSYADGLGVKGMFGRISGSVTTCQNHGSITASHYAGGIAGIILSGGQVANCGLEGAEINGRECAAVVRLVSSGAKLTDCYAIVSTNSDLKLVVTKSGTIGGLVGIITSGGTSKKVYTGSDFSGFAWLNFDSSPVPKGLSLAGQFQEPPAEYAGNSNWILTKMQSEGWTEILV